MGTSTRRAPARSGSFETAPRCRATTPPAPPVRPHALSLAGGPPALLSAQIPRAYTAQIDLAINDRIFGGNPWDPRNVIHVRRELLLTDRLRERLTLVSSLRRPIDYTIELAIGCDFADIFEVRGWRREQRGRYFAPRCD